MHETKRRIVVRNSNEALNLSKRAIFSYHRDDVKSAQENLAQAEKIFARLDREAKGMPALRHEGSWRAALEEYCEAKLFGEFLHSGCVCEIRDRQVDTEIYIGGLSDFTGELVRRAVREATEKNFEDVRKIKDAITEIMSQLIQLDLAGYLRTKYDQAKNNLRKIEEIMYEVSLRK